MFSLKLFFKNFFFACVDAYYWLILFFSDTGRKKVLLGGLLLFSVALAYGIGYFNGQSRYQKFEEEMERVAASLEMDLSGDTWLDKVLLLKQKIETSAQTHKQLSVYLADKEEEIENLNRQLHFYRRVIAPEDLTANQLAVFDVKLKEPLSDGAYPIEVIVRKSMKENAFVRGEMMIHVEGLVEQKRLLHKDGLDEDLPFAFRYFQRLHGLIRLPDHYEPQTLHLILMVDKREKLRKSYSWQELLAQRNASDV